MAQSRGAVAAALTNEYEEGHGCDECGEEGVVREGAVEEEVEEH